jgi:hypothetical protein
MLLFTEEKIAWLLAEIRPTVWRETYPIPTFKFHEGDCPGAQHPDFDDTGWAENSRCVSSSARATAAARLPRLCSM